MNCDNNSAPIYQTNQLHSISDFFALQFENVLAQWIKLLQNQEIRMELRAGMVWKKAGERKNLKWMKLKLNEC